MRIFAQNEPLTETELDRLEEFLKSCKGGKAMSIEELDGFFAALIAGPEVVMPREYLPEVFGGEMSDTCEFASLDKANEILALLMRHWNDIAHRLGKDEVYVPLLLEDEKGVARGNSPVLSPISPVLIVRSCSDLMAHYSELRFILLWFDFLPRGLFS